MKTNTGLTLVEVIVASAIFLIFAVGTYQGIIALQAAMAAARYKALAVDLANGQFEVIRNMPYTSVGVVGGSPSGTLQSPTTITRDGISFTVTTSVQYVDDPFDATASTGDLFPHDYKLVEIAVDCATCKNFSPIAITTLFAPKNLESS